LNPSGGPLSYDNGTGLGELYCYGAADSIDTRARKACESHWGTGACCIIGGGYNGLQWGLCGQDGSLPAAYHWHPDSHPSGHCLPDYVPGDVVKPGWCGTIVGRFMP